LTSANLVGDEAPTTAQGVVKQLGDSVPLLLDDGPTRYGGASTVARVLGNRLEVLREGVIERAAMNQFVKPVVALVCTGNTCRSPMAETLLREQLRKKFGCEDAVRVLSAGVAAGQGSGASPQAIEVMGSRCLDLTGHSSRALDDEVMNVADLVLTMTRGHRAAILAAWPDMQDRVHTLRRDGGDISDPVGMPVDVYEACAEQIDRELAAWIEALDADFFPATSKDL
jgi:protein-tyrosine phosphatase